MTAHPYVITCKNATEHHVTADRIELTGKFIEFWLDDTLTFAVAAESIDKIVQQGDIQVLAELQRAIREHGKDVVYGAIRKALYELG